MSAACCSASPTGYPRAARTVLTSVSAWLTALEGSSTKRRWTATIHAAASDAIENWLDLTSDPRLAITALSTIAMTQPDSLPNPAPPAPAALPPNVTYINASLGPSSHHRDDTLCKIREAGT